MAMIGYIASGGFGNRVAAVSSYLYDSQYVDRHLVWETSYFGNCTPEKLWPNWNIPYILHSPCIYDCRNWYIHANAAKSKYVRSWWNQLIPNNSVVNDLKQFELQYEIAICIRLINKPNPIYPFDYDKACDIMKNIPDNKILITSDNNQSINILLEKSNKKFHYYKTIHRMDNNPENDISVPRSENELHTGIMDWYLLQRSKKIYKNNPISTFPDYAEHICDIPVEIL